MVFGKRKSKRRERRAPFAIYEMSSNLKPRTCEKLNPFFWIGNIDDPVPPDWYRPNNRTQIISQLFIRHEAAAELFFTQLDR